jgi:hypothetical protein
MSRSYVPNSASVPDGVGLPASCAVRDNGAGSPPPQAAANRTLATTAHDLIRPVIATLRATRAAARRRAHATIREGREREKSDRRVSLRRYVVPYQDWRAQRGRSGRGTAARTRIGRCLAGSGSVRHGLGRAVQRSLRGHQLTPRERADRRVGKAVRNAGGDVQRYFGR